MSQECELQLLESPFKPGLTVIEASAGTGKTYSISHLVPRLLLEGTLQSLSELLLVTFTKDAAHELAERVRQVLLKLDSPAQPEEAAQSPDLAKLRRLAEQDEEHRARLRHAVMDLDLLAVSTIHAFCQRTLQQEGSLCGLPSMPELSMDDEDWVQALGRDLWLDKLSRDPVLAAIATSSGWSLDSVIQVLRSLRSFPQPQLIPAPQPLPVALAELLSECAKLRAPALSADLPALLQSVLKWSKGNSAEAVLERMETLRERPLASLDFWSALADLGGTELASRVNKQSKIGKSVAASLQAHPWQAQLSRTRLALNALTWSWNQALADELQPRVAEKLHRQRVITQDGLIETLHRALCSENPEQAASARRLGERLAQRYSVALIDESQDTDPRQFAIFERIFLLSRPLRHLILVGDPKQAIYRFRGADLDTYLGARNRADSRYTLTRTFRSPQPLVEAVNRLFHRPRSFHHAEMPFKPSESGLSTHRELIDQGRASSPLEFWLAEDGDHAFTSAERRQARLARTVACDIVRLLRQGALRETKADGVSTTKPLDPSCFAVLVARHSQALCIQEALTSRGVPAVINSGADVFASEEAAELLRLLEAVLNPKRAPLLRSALGGMLLGLDAKALARIDEAEADGQSAFQRWTDRFTAWSLLWHNRGLAFLLSAWEHPGEGEESESLLRRLASARGNGERRVTNFRQLTDLLLDATREHAPKPEDLLRWLKAQISRANATRAEAEERQLQLSTDKKAVQVVTMHAAKGLQYPLVYCPFLADTLQRPGGELSLLPLEEQAQPTESGKVQPKGLFNLPLLQQTGQEAELSRRLAQLFRSELQERLRLAYVALTRAEVKAWTCTWTGHGAGLSVLDWLLRTEQECALEDMDLDAFGTTASTTRQMRHQTVLESLGAANVESASKPSSESSGASETKRETASELGSDAKPSPLSYRRFPNLPEDSVALAVVSKDFVPATTASPEELSQAATGFPSNSAAQLPSALPAPSIPRAWRNTSFSSITREKHEHGAPSLPLTPASISLSVTPDEIIEPGTDESFETAEPTLGPGLFFNAPGGTSIGTAVHDWIETWDFSEPDPEALAAHVNEARLPQRKEGEPSWEDTFADLFTRLRQAELPGLEGLPLHQLCPEAHGSEWNFLLPIGARFSIEALATCFEQHAAPTLRGYGHALRSLQYERLEGFLTGFIDRLIRKADGNLGLLDWKTNRLGDSLPDYSPEALLAAAMESHYLLQMHLYLVALLRYQRSFLPEAPPPQAWLVYVRALIPGTPGGVLPITPSLELLEALDALFEGPRP